MAAQKMQSALSTQLNVHLKAVFEAMPVKEALSAILLKWRDLIMEKSR